MKKIDEKVLQGIFDDIVRHFECLGETSYDDLERYLIGARYALYKATDYNPCICIGDFFEQKLDEYFGGKESE